MILLISFLIIGSVYGKLDTAEDARLNFTELAVKYGQRAEEFDVVTEDGYILKLFHIIGDARRPVLLIHGILDSSDGFIIRGNLSLAVNLARRGYDVWAMNNRGNRYSRRHLTLDPDTDKAFWDFYVNDYGTKDVSTNIDFITNKTGSKINIVCFSQGTTNTFVLGAARPEYNDKVNVVIALAPIYYIHHARQFLGELIKLGPNINRGLRMSGSEEIGGFYSPIKPLLTAVCDLGGVGYLLCVMGGVFTLSGFDPNAFEPDFVPVWIGHFPAGTSRKNMNHLIQVGNNKRFAYYDYGPKNNMVMYKSRTPPEYDIRKVTMKVALLLGKNDIVSTVEDVKLLRKKLPNVVEYRVMDYDSFNHIDFMWGKTTYTVVLPQVLDILEKYSER